MSCARHLQIVRLGGMIEQLRIFTSEVMRSCAMSVTKEQECVWRASKTAHHRDASA
jgi:hypothetical protein